MIRKFKSFYAIAMALALVASASAFAQSSPQGAGSAPENQRNVAAIAAERNDVRMHLAHAMPLVNNDSHAMTPFVSASGSVTNTSAAASTFRAYPASCLTNPLPAQATGPVYSANVVLAANDGSPNPVPEPVTISVWRVACSQNTSATLMRIERKSELYMQYVLFPGIRMAQGSVMFDDPSHLDFIRNAVEPNTIYSTVYPDDPVPYSTTFVLEYFRDPAYVGQNYNKTLSLRIDNFFLAGNQFFINNIPAYAPTSGTYPAAFLPIPLSGYLSGNYYDPQHSGEGINVEVDELAGGARVLFFAWFTFDDLGAPYWLFGSSGFNDGDTSVSVPTAFESNGGFAGAFGPKATTTLWGNVTFTFPDCNHLTLQYASQSGLPAHTPIGSGTLNWQRLTSINGIVCQ